MYTAIFTPYVAAFLLNEQEGRKSKKYGEDPIVIIDLIGEWMFPVAFETNGSF